MMILDFDTISERMREAAFCPEMWVPLLDDIAIATKSGEGGIGVYWPTQRGIMTSSRISDAVPPWEQRPEQIQHWVTKARLGAYVNKGFFESEPHTADWSIVPGSRRRASSQAACGSGPQATAIIELFSGEMVALEFRRRIDEPRYDARLLRQLNTILPSFRQSMFFASRMQFERARSSLDTLNDFGLPAALLSPTGQVVYLNSLFEEMDEYLTRLPNGQISVRGSEKLRKAFAQSLEQSASVNVEFAVPADDGRGAAVVQLMPMSCDVQAIFSTPCKVMVISPIATAIGVPSPDLVGKLFGLTPAESRLATTLASGLSLRDTAEKQGIGLGTARSYLMRVFSKTGTDQQSELVSLLKGVFPSSGAGLNLQA